MADDQKFKEFMKHVDNVIIAKTQTFGVDDFADAPWRDLFDDTDGQATDEDIYETLAEADDLFAMYLDMVE